MVLKIRELDEVRLRIVGAGCGDRLYGDTPAAG